MQKIPIGRSGITASEIALGCMRIHSVPYEKALETVACALQNGVNFFDHADVYGQGQSEEIFRQIVRDLGARREDIVIQSKCGIREGYYDFSKSHIVASVDQILSRLGTDYLDILLLHRPDALVEPEEVAEAFGILHASGKVRSFGVSNHNALQIALLARYVPFPIVANQLQFSIAHAQLAGAGLHVNMLPAEGEADEREAGLLDYCRLHNITIQAWSPFQFGFFAGAFVGHPKYQPLNDLLESIATKYGVTKTAIAVAWILRHPARIQTVVGTMSRRHMEEIAAASGIWLTREEWYGLYAAAGKTIP